MDGFWSSFSKWFNEKISSPLYFTYIGFFVAWNWKFFQIIFFESSSLFQGPRIEYIDSKLRFSVSFSSKIPMWISVCINWIANLVWHIGPPVIFTYLAIIYLPKLHKWAFDKYLENRYERKKILEIKQRDYNNWMLEQEKKDKQTLENIKTVKEQKTKIEKAIEKTMTEKERHEFEYQEFEKDPSFFKFRQIIDTIYKYEGYIETGGV